MKMNRFLITGLFVFFGGWLTSCENEVDINADWKETMVVYGLLDPNDTIQYIKVNKAFLNNNTSALVAAQNSDSLYLKNVEVNLIRLNTGEVIPLQKTNNKIKNPGIFSSDVNYLYTTKNAIAENEPYKVEVKSGLTGNIASAVTWTLRKARIEAPFRSNTPIFSLAANYITISYVPGTNAYAFDIKMTAQIEEYNAADTSFIGTKNITWNIITNYAISQPGFNQPMQTVIHQIDRLSFLQFLANSLTVSKNIIRKFKTVGIQYYGGSQNLIDYISVNEPSIGIVQKQAEYSNIEGGFGLFGSRCKQEVNKVPLEPASIGILQSNPATKELNFIR